MRGAAQYVEKGVIERARPPDPGYVDQAARDNAVGVTEQRQQPWLETVPSDRLPVAEDRGRRQEAIRLIRHPQQREGTAPPHGLLPPVTPGLAHAVADPRAVGTHD